MRALIAAGIAVALCTALGCSTAGQSKDGDATASRADAKGADEAKLLTTTCASAQDRGFAPRCVVNVQATVDEGARTCDVVPPDIILSGQRKVVIVWDLPAGYQFCPALGDGVFLKNSGDLADEQFDSMNVPDDGLGNPTYKKCRNRFRWLAENSANYGTEYKYLLKFRHKATDIPCAKDPFIRNG